MFLRVVSMNKERRYKMCTGVVCAVDIGLRSESIDFFLVGGVD